MTKKSWLTTVFTYFVSRSCKLGAFRNQLRVTKTKHLNIVGSRNAQLVTLLHTLEPQQGGFLRLDFLFRSGKNVTLYPGVDIINACLE